MDLALYSEHGFYSTTGRAGRRGDFITSAEVGPLFGTVLALAIDDVWKRLGKPDNFQINQNVYSAVNTSLLKQVQPNEHCTQMV